MHSLCLTHCNPCVADNTCRLLHYVNVAWTILLLQPHPSFIYWLLLQPIGSTQTASIIVLEDLYQHCPRVCVGGEWSDVWRSLGIESHKINQGTGCASCNDFLHCYHFYSNIATQLCAVCIQTCHTAARFYNIWKNLLLTLFICKTCITALTINQILIFS